AQRINLQLQTLETNRVAWQGELWPGQKLEWEVSEDPPKSTSAPNEQSSWTSTVRFELPTLGVITASIYLDGDHVRMQVRAPTENAALRLRQNGHDLVNALDAAGSPLDLLTVKSDGQT
ncbi:MAG: flagellar hook-length control protein FliK, partial [Herminiimonas sp.]|nr:flagellar hook-length control protein FliK [Herminiimonas sp.]